MRELGLDVEVDAAGNLLGRWRGGQRHGLVLVGSHLDTVPVGRTLRRRARGRRRRPCGRLLKQEGFEPAGRSGSSRSWTRRGRASTRAFGSRAFAGEDVTGLGDRVDAGGTTLRDAMATAGHDLDRHR